MKKLLLVATIFCGFAIFGQEQIVFSKIIENPGVKKDDLYKRNIVAASKILYSANDEVQFKDESSGKIIIKSSEIISYSMGKGLLSETIEIDVKDGKTRIKIYNYVFQHQNYPDKLVRAEEYPKSWAGSNSFKKSLQDSANKIFTIFESQLNNQSDDNW